MNGIVCDGCGEGLLIRENVRYELKMEGYAAYAPMEITHADLQKDLDAEVEDVLDELSQMDEESAQDQVHRRFAFDLCARCWQRFLANPLGAVR